MKEFGKLVGVLIVAQVLGMGIYEGFKRIRSGGGESAAEALSTDGPYDVDLRFRRMTGIRWNGNIGPIAVPERPTLLHVWASWCPPCRAELPALLRLGEREDLDVVAVAMDDSWERVREILGGQEHPAVLRGNPGEMQRTLHVETLPVTFLVFPDGRITKRWEGARDWSDERVVGGVLELVNAVEAPGPPPATGPSEQP